MMYGLSWRLFFIIMLILSTVLFLQITGIQAQLRRLPPNEVNVLREIAKELGKQDWDFSLNPCDGNVNWTAPSGNHPRQFNNSINCTCFPDDTCHVFAISMKGQDLAGVLPPSLAKLPSIKIIDLAFNYLNGNIPKEWVSTKLESIAVTGNRLSGNIPTFLGNITTLQNLVLTANNLTGELPMELMGLTNLTELRLDSNYFSGKIPNLGSFTRLEKLEMQGSGLKGPIPTSISLLTNLSELAISDLNGEGSQLFPDLSSSMTNMKKLMLRGCKLRGSIPSYISNMPKLQYLDLSFNYLSGDIPDLSELKKLETMYLTGNSLNGSVPSWLTDEPDSEREVDLSYNHFTESSIPKDKDCPESLNLFRSYTSSNDSDLGKCLKRCLNFNYSVNINCGGPRVTIGDKVYEADQDPIGAARFHPLNNYCGISNTGRVWNTDKTSNDYVATNVSILAMNNSQLYTTARRSQLSLTYYGRCLVNGNYTVTLHFAEIVFRDNRSYQGLGRRIFDVYVQGINIFKNFDIKNEAGGVDKEVIKTLNNVSVTNTTLEIRFQYAGKGTTAVPVRGLYGPLISAISMEAVSKPQDSKTRSHGKKIPFVVIEVLAAALILTLIIVGVAWKKGYIRKQILKERDLRGLELHTGVFTYKQIKDATNNFDESNKLGEGGFGSVYKGTLSDGSLIAVKKLSSKSKQGNREFVNEIGMIAGIQHPNVVRLHGCCAEHNHLLLVYEYMENNSLAHALFVLDNNEANMKIDWATRQRICVGIARGLAFLHEETALNIVHRDIKATNILLDTDLTPKISDFGLAKLNEKENTHISTRIAGTMGYMAPEYALWGYLTYKADVYSFGVLALEIVAGKPNMKYRPNEDYVSLLDLAIVLKENGSLIDLVDPRLGSHFNKIEAVTMMKVAILCTSQSPALRPTMSEVVNMLEGRTKIKESVMNLASQDEFGLQRKGKLEDIQPQQDSLVEQSSYSVHDLYPNSRVSDE